MYGNMCKGPVAQRTHGFSRVLVGFSLVGLIEANGALAK